MTKSIQIFKSGKHTAVSGITLEFSEDVVSQIAESYDAASFAAPLVVGHPKLDDPAYGWVKSLSFSEGILSAIPEQVDPAFAELVNAGKFKKVSASIYMPDSPSNPTPGKYHLRHVGFLGAAAPAVKGLKTASFAEETGAESFEFGELNDCETSSLARIVRGLRDWVAGKFTLEDADKAIPSYLVEDLERAAARPMEPMDAPTGAISSFAEVTPPKPGPAASVAPLMEAKMADHAKAELEQAEFAEKQAALETKLADLATRESQLAAGQASLRKAEFAAFAEGLTTEGRLSKPMTLGMVDFMEALHSGVTTLEFGEGDDKKTPTALEYFKTLVASLPKAVEFAEVVKPGDGKVLPSVEFSAAPGFDSDQAGLEELAAARAYATTNNCGLMDALIAIGGSK